MKLSNVTKSSVKIATGSSMVSLACLLAAFIAPDGIAKDLLINLSASFIIIAATALIIDGVRIREANSNLKNAKKSGINQIVSAHHGLLFYVVPKHYLKTEGFKGEMAKAITAGGYGADNEFNKFLIAKAREMKDYDASRISEPFTKGNFMVTLKFHAERLTVKLDKIGIRYDFTFKDVELNTRFAELQYKADEILETINLIETTDFDVNQLLKDEFKGQDGSKIMIGALLADYIKSYLELLDTFNDI